jgi:hypothetical protein
MIMSLTTCRFCQHSNPPDSNYCNACGGILTLAPCPHCGAVTEVTATTCYQCRGSLQGSSQGTPVPELPDAAMSQPSPLQPSLPEPSLLEPSLPEPSLPEPSLPEPSLPEPSLSEPPIRQPALRQASLGIAGTVVVASVAFIGYYAYLHYSLVGLPPSAANTETERRSDTAQPASTPGSATTPTIPVTATPTSAVSSSGTIPAPPTSPATPQIIQPHESREPVEPPVAAVPAAVAHPQTKDGRESCTEAVIALGLCAPKSK